MHRVEPQFNLFKTNSTYSGKEDLGPLPCHWRVTSPHFGPGYASSPQLPPLEMAREILLMDQLIAIRGMREWAASMKH